MRRSLRRFAVGFFGMLPVLIVLGLFVAPLAAWAWSFGPSMKNVPKVSPGEMYKNLVGATFLFSVAAAAVAVFFGTTAACLHRFSSHGVQRSLTILMTVPLLIGFLARNYSWLGILRFMSGDQSPADFVRAIGGELLYTGKGVAIVMGTVFIPFSYFIVVQGFSALKPEFLAAARTLGASDYRSLVAVVFPVVSRSMLLAFGLSTVLAIGYFVTPQMIGGGNEDFIGNGVLTLLNKLGDTTGASILASYLLLTSVLPMLFLVWYSLKRRSLFVGG